MGEKSKVLLNSGLYTFSSILVKAIGFLLLPIYTMFLTPDDYGITNLVSNFSNVMSIIAAFSLYSAVTRFYADYKYDREKLKNFYGTVIVFVFGTSSILAIFGVAFQQVFINCFFEGITFYPIVLIAFFNLIFACQHTIHQSIMSSMQEGQKYTIINLIVFVCTVCLNLIFIGIFRLGAVGVLLATLIINLLYFIFMLNDLIKNNLISFRFDRGLLKEALKYSIPIMPHNLSTSVASWISRLFLNSSGSLASVGLYSVATQFGTIIDTVQISVNAAFTPWFYEVMNQGDNKSKQDIVGLSRFLLILYSILYMIIGLFSQEALIIMATDSYIIAWTVIPILVVAFSVKSIYYFYVNVLFYYKDAAKKIFVATIIGSFADIVLAFVLVHEYGMYGAAVAFLIAKVIILAIVVVMSKSYEDIGYKITDMLKIVIPSLLFMGIGLYFSYAKYLKVFSWINLFYKVGVFAAYLSYIYLTNKKIINGIIRSGRIQQMLRRKKHVTQG